MLYADGEQALGSRYGPETLGAVHDIDAVLAARIEETPTARAVWTAFRKTPRSAGSALLGTLEALFEADPALEARLAALVSDADRTTAAVAGPGGVDTVRGPTGRSPRRPLRTQGPAGASPVRQDGYDDSVDAGTYLYGNAAAGGEQVEPDSAAGMFKGTRPSGEPRPARRSPRTEETDDN
jgi:hypothetical protein